MVFPFGQREALVISLVRLSLIAEKKPFSAMFLGPERLTQVLITTPNKVQK
jgi:hypothetical protein